MVEGYASLDQAPKSVGVPGKALTPHLALTADHVFGCGELA